MALQFCATFAAKSGKRFVSLEEKGSERSKNIKAPFPGREKIILMLAKMAPLSLTILIRRMSAKIISHRGWGGEENAGSNL